MTISMPLIIGGMAYGLALSEEAKVALAKTSKILQTAICYGKRPLEQIAAADMLEMQIGQGADVGADRVGGYRN